jgi:hypothetical protein
VDAHFFVLLCFFCQEKHSYEFRLHSFYKTC